ncbi:MAG: 3-deoxy-D-manno-octulosonic acid transferase [Candidatus Anammoxibacter sp.]
MLLDLLYFVGILITLPYLTFKVIANEKYRVGFFQRLGFVDKRHSKNPCVWIHGSSVGEILTGRTLINKIESEFPDIDIVISSWTNTGLATAKKNFKDKYVFFFPIDISFAVKSVFRRIRPDYIILIELEIWPNFFIITKNNGIPTILVNGRISEKSMTFYRKLSFFSKNFRKSLVSNKIYCARTEADAIRFRQLSILPKNINITGTMKYDNIMLHGDEDATAELLSLFHIGADDVVIVGGSTHNGEEEALINVFKALKNEFANLRLILVPRHIERANDIVTLIERMGFSAAKKTDLDTNDNLTLSDKSDNDIKDNIIVVNTIGELNNIYAIADCVFVGRSLVPFGGQNMMEPAGLAKPVIFGPHTYNFKEESKLLLENNSAKLVTNENELLDTIRLLLANPTEAKEMGLRAQKVVLDNQGATERNMEILRKYFKSEAILN